MRIHYLQHVPFESPGNISVWAEKNGHELTGTLLYETDCFPTLAEFDMLVILGGPMGACDEDAFPWLIPEKQLIKESVRQHKLVLGICLGAQLIAESLGGKVYKNDHKEIGWFPVKLTEEARHSVIFQDIPDEFVPFHWHGDTFQLPAEAKRMAFSDGCANQAYLYKDHVIGLQFHLESNDSGIKKLIEHCADEIEEGLYIQPPHDILAQSGRQVFSNEILYALLDALERDNRPREEKPGPDYERSEPYRIVGD